MNRSDFVQALAQRCAPSSLQDTELAVDTLLQALTDALVRDQRVEIRGFGSFTVTHRPARVGRNPRTGQTVPVSPKHVPHFKPGKALREAVAKIP